VTVLVLLALSDDGVPVHDAREAAELSARGAVVMACTPAEFPELLGAALQGGSRSVVWNRPDVVDPKRQNP
jgi:hypothetical protein